MRRKRTGNKQNRKNRNRRPVRGQKPKRRPRSQRKVTPPRTAKHFFALSKQAQHEWIQATHVVSKMRTDGDSLSRASREFGLDPQLVLRIAGPALRKRKNGRYVAKPTDKLLRVLAVPTPDGVREVALRNSRQASQLADYWNAVHQYLTTGDSSAIRKFKGKQITATDGSKIRFVTDLKELDRLGSAGNLSFESIYPK